MLLIHFCALGQLFLNHTFSGATICRSLASYLRLINFLYCRKVSVGFMVALGSLLKNWIKKQEEEAHRIREMQAEAVRVRKEEEKKKQEKRKEELIKLRAGKPFGGLFSVPLIPKECPKCDSLNIKIVKRNPKFGTYITLFFTPPPMNLHVCRNCGFSWEDK